MQISKCKLQNEVRLLGVGWSPWRPVSIAAAACLLLMTLGSSTFAQEQFSFDDIRFWVGSGQNRAAVAIDWIENQTEPPALVWGFRWDGTAHGNDMLTAVIAADPRLFAKLGGSSGNPNAVYGIGYDADADGQFAIDDDTDFDLEGIAFTSPADGAMAVDAADYYAEGWFIGFWHYGVASGNPYDGASWTDTAVGMASRELTDGAWDSWTFSPTFNFASFAENPVAATAPFPPGDFNQDGRVDASDYGEWRGAFGSISNLAADGSGNGMVDAADYVIWRREFSLARSSASPALVANIPEPQSALLFTSGLLVTQLLIRRNTNLR